MKGFQLYAFLQMSKNDAAVKTHVVMVLDPQIVCQTDGTKRQTHKAEQF
jgi:hypothetical protein